ncbi:unnamed protein product [Diabrotica balteata]|uniref:Regulatory protein zeste n=1 Tax=Diabrotica balteata TaxID=107213 RepID=A0A9N9ST61_DIABA|nr:unnamed protein product [Diabrotica balteata]
MEMQTIKVKRSTNASDEQKKLLLEFMKKNPNLLAAKFSNTFSQNDAQNKWQGIANVLNSCGDGANKNWRAWRKTWQDIRSRTKAKNGQLKKHAQGTGGGPPIEKANPFEQEVLETITVISLAGQPDIVESEANFCFNEEENLTDHQLKPDAVDTTDTIEELEQQQPTVAPIKLEKSPIKNKPKKKLEYTSEAAENYQLSLNEKNKIKLL